MTDDRALSALLRSAALRVTVQRVAVLHELGAHPHADVDTLAGGVRDRLGRISTQAVYDVLRALTDAGLVRRIEPAGSPARYELHTGDNHHHLVCRSCASIVDVACATGSPPCLDAPSSPADRGFVVDEAEVIYWGRCTDCSSAVTTTGAAHTATARTTTTRTTGTTLDSRPGRMKEQV